MTQDMYMRPKELASDLGVHPTTIVRWINAGIIPAMRIGPRTFRIVRKDVQRVLNINN